MIKETNMKKITTLTSALVLGLTTTCAVQAADSIIFDPDGTGSEGSIVVGSFDWTQDNALALDSTPQETGDDFTIALQASLGNFVAPDNSIITTTGLNTDYEITFQSVFEENVALNLETLGVGNTANFLLAATQPTNFFNIYWDDLGDAAGDASNPQTGEGYGDGTQILTAVLTANATTFFIPYTQDFCTGSCADGTFVPDGVLDTAAISDLDQSANGDQQPGVGTVEGGGGGTLEADVTSQDSDFFLDPTVQLILDLFFNSSQVVPFEQIDPTGPITCTDGIVGNCPNLALNPFGVGGFDLINGVFPGLGCEDGTESCDFLFQADANQSFAAERVVPEPSIIALLGLGLGVLGFVSTRRRRHQ
jgi:hypothetical protein